MRRTSLCLLVGLALAFEVNCGSVSGDGSGTGGTGGGQSGGSGQTGTGGSGGGGTAGAHGGSGGQGGDVATTGGAGGHATGGAGGHATGGVGGHATGGVGGHATGGGGGHATGGAAGGGAGGGGHAGAGAGGSSGAGGKAATGGHGGGGQGGQTADSGVSCAELASEYSAALPAAEACTPGAANQCQQLVPLSLSICTGCEHYVTDATTLNALRTQWTNQGCNLTTALIVCPAIACISPGTAGDCVAVDGSANGVCGYGVATPAN